MSFSQAIQNVFNNYANFNGRARRSEYWYFYLLNILVSFLFSFMATFSEVFTYMSYIYTLATLIPGLAVTWRRLHDTGHSGAYVLLSLIPLVGAIIVLVALCKDSDQGYNAYGESPKYPAYVNGGYNNYSQPVQNYVNQQDINYQGYNAYPQNGYNQDGNNQNGNNYR